MKIMFFSLFVVLLLVSTRSFCDVSVCDASECSVSEMHNRFTTAFCSGYVFKFDDKRFKQVYGQGMGNVITGDICYHPFYNNSCWKLWGIGAKISYWLAFGKTTFFKHKTWLQEIPMTAYIRRMFDFKCGLQLYASLGGGAAWIREKSYLGKVSRWRGLGEVEAGLLYPAWCRLDFTSAVRYLFPRQSQNHRKANVGGLDLRAGIGYSF